MMNDHVRQLFDLVDVKTSLEIREARLSIARLASLQRSPRHWPAVGSGLWSHGVEDLLENLASSKPFQRGR